MDDLITKLLTNQNEQHNQSIANLLELARRYHDVLNSMNTIMNELQIKRELLQMLNQEKEILADAFNSAYETALPWMNMDITDDDSEEENEGSYFCT